MPDLRVLFLEAGKQTAAEVATQLAHFITGASHSLDLALYDVHLSGHARDILIGALQERQRGGVPVRICYDSGDNTKRAYDRGAEPPTTQTGKFLATTGLPSKAIASQMDLMHHKYIIRDAGTPQAAVCTGSSNYTDASWTLQENNILFLPSAELARFYSCDFEELWKTADITTTGDDDTGYVTLQYAGTPAPATVAFSPGEGDWIEGYITECLTKAQREVTLGFAVLTSTRILKALGGLIERGVPIDGVYDQTQMEGVFYQWSLVPQNNWKIPAFHQLVEYAHLAGKHSIPWSATSIHDFMHNKLMVVDDTVITGSYNFSRSAQANAENVLLIQNAALAADYRAYLRRLAARYGQAG
ncbi:MAG TPA: phospholipase D-like domain-containing protein [Chloroflexia bacterium]|nr:phospholipase D-like domain-containing protein [Chloroflexia bacterium]